MTYNFSENAYVLLVEAVFQQILTLSSQYNERFYMIYQSNDDSSTLAQLVAEKPLKSFRYGSYNIEYTPGLIELNLDDEQDKILLKESIQSFCLAIDPKETMLAKPRFVYGWVFSSLSSDILAKQLGQIAIQPSFDGDRLIRYFDPVVFSSLSTILTRAQKDKLLNPVHCWLYLNGDGELVIETNVRIVRKHISYHLGIEPLQWQKIAWIESRNQVLARYRFFYRDKQRLSEKDADKIISQAFEKALTYGYHEKQDLSEYAYRSLVIHPDFIQHPVVRAEIKQNNVNSLINQLRNITQSQWDVLTNEYGFNLTGVEQ